MQIEEGKFYKTRDGRKIGPMFAFDDVLGGWEYKWTNDNSPDRGRLWREDVTSGRGMPEHDLIEEWIEEGSKITPKPKSPVVEKVVKSIEPGKYGKIHIGNQAFFDQTKAWICLIL